MLVENFRPGTMEKWGLGYESLAAANPRLIMARVSGFGQTGPYAARAGYGLIGEAMGGLRAITGEPDRPPARAGVSIGDSLAATHAVMGILMALHVRERTGRGQVIDAAIYESVLAMMENLVTEYDLTGYVRERSGSVLPGIAPSNVYPTADGMILIGGNGDTVFARLCEAMGEAGAEGRSALPRPRQPRRQPDRARRAHRRLVEGLHLGRPAGAAGAVRRALRPRLPRAGDAGRSAVRRPRGHRHGRPPGVRPDPHAERLPEAQRDARRGALAGAGAGRAHRGGAGREARALGGEAGGAEGGGRRLSLTSERLTRGDIVARLERLPPSRPIWGLVALISLGGASSSTT